MREIKEATNESRHCVKKHEFIAVRRAVMRLSECIASARSHTMARRIAEALNRYRPGPKGY